ALAVDAEGRLYVGTSPRGRIYRLDPTQPDAGVEVYAEIPEVYIWELLFDAEGHLLVATGGGGKVYRLPPNYRLGQDLTQWLAVDERHVGALALDSEGNLLAGTGPNGYIYKVTGQDAAFALHHAKAEEIRALVAGADGAVYYSTFEDARGSSSGDPEEGGRSGIGDPQPANGGNGSGTSARSGGKGSEVFRISSDGFVDSFFKAPRGSRIYALAPTDSGWLVGTDDEGRLFRMNGPRDWSLLQTAEGGGEVTHLLPHPEGGHWLLTSNPARAYRLSGESAQEGTFTSDVLDAGQIAAWGVGHATPRIPGSDRQPAIETRSGNSAKPDDFWSNFKPLDDNGAILSPAARYLQFKATFEPGETLRKAEFFYRLKNQAPEIERIAVVPGGFEVFSAPPSRGNVNLRQFLQGDGDPEMQEPEPRERLVQTAESGTMTALWKAGDPNDDVLRYRFELRGPLSDPDTPWVLLGDELESPLQVFDLRGLDSGYYLARVTASDRISNPNGTALETTLESDPFLIDTESPEIEITSRNVSGRRASIELRASDQLGRITEVTYRLDGGSALPLRPNDGIFDEATETLLLDLLGLAPGERGLVLTAIDESGNRAIRTLTLTISDQYDRRFFAQIRFPCRLRTVRIAHKLAK
ncbi:MAG: hypothetical protein ACOCVG_04175, partial [Verrucomicrobiota bacterium]